MNPQFKKIIENELESIKEKGLFKEERILGSKQGRKIKGGAKSYLNFCSNNYLGLAGDKKIMKAGKRAMEKWRFGLSSVRFICGTQKNQKELERKVARFM